MFLVQLKVHISQFLKCPQCVCPKLAVLLQICPMNGRAKTYRAVGQMSGTSGDGSDWVSVDFTLNPDDSWCYNIQKSHAFPYTNEWSERLRNAPYLDALPYAELERDYERLLASQYAEFAGGGGAVKKDVESGANSGMGEWNDTKPHIIGLHGHTVWHQPEAGITTALGAGHILHAQTRIPVAAQFRKGDVALGGQGAPLVPIGDRLLFAEYDACINLGGVMNISLESEGVRRAYDVGICNMALNRLAEKMGMAFDRDGMLGARFEADEVLLRELNKLAYHQLAPPKSTGREWAEACVFPLLDARDPGVALATVYAYIAGQIEREVRIHGLQKVLITGGGAHNTHLIRLLNAAGIPFEVPERELVDYKEAVIFAFLGLLRLMGRNNVLASATGASADHCSGVLLGG